MFRGFRSRGPSSYPAPMAHRSHIIATAAEVVLDRRIRGDEAKCAAAAERVGGSPADRASAEFFVGALTFMAEEAGVHAVRDVLQRHRLALVQS
jgi:uncharacterized protein (DUF169 family)